MKSEAQTIQKELPAYSPWPRRLIVVFFLLLPFGMLLQGYLYFIWAGTGELRKTMAELDEKEGAWRIEDIEAKRATFPDAENSALVVRAITGIEQKGSGLLPDDWPDHKKSALLDHLPPEIQMTDGQISYLKEALQKAEIALQQAHRLADMPNGRYPITYSKDGLSTLLPHVHANRRCVNLLRYDVLHLLHEGKMESAARSCWGMINTTRALGDEPTLISMIVRIAGRAVTIQTIERMLGQGELPTDALAGLQAQLERELHVPLLYYGVLGERGLTDRLMTALENGDVSMTDALRMYGGNDIGDYISVNNPFVNHVLNGIIFMWRSGALKVNHAALLKYYTRLVDVARLPFDEQEMELTKVEISNSDQLPLVRILIPAMMRIREVSQRDRAMMQCTIAMLAAERYRLKHGKLPSRLADLNPEFMKSAVGDPHSKGNSLLFVKRPDSIMIYSVGPNGKDDGGLLDRIGGGMRKDMSTDIGVQLFEPAFRRRLPLPEEPKESSEPDA